MIYDAFSYSDFGDGTTYKNFSLTYPLRERLDAELRWIYLDNGIEERLQIPLLLKQYLSKKAYLLGGVQVEYDLKKSRLLKKSRYDALFGVGQELNEAIIIESTLQNPLRKISVLPLGSLNANKPFFNIGSKFKF